MKAGYRGTFVLSWAETELDGLSSPPMGALTVGAVWRWTGTPVRVDGPDSVLVLGPAIDAEELRARAAKSVRRLIGAAMAPPTETVARLPDAAAPVLDAGFAMTDGAQSYTATIVEAPEHGARLVMFVDALPPRDRELWITHVAEGRPRVNRQGDGPPGVICFTPETAIATPDGPRAAGDLAEGDWVLTKDAGPQRILWTGRRRLSGALLRAIPDLRPIRVRAGAAGSGRPDRDLLLSPDHRLLVKGPVAQDLFGTPEVLVAARDLLNDRTVTRDHRLTEAIYVHLLLDRHQILFANGVETESLHPAGMAFEAVDPQQRAALIQRCPEIAADPFAYGDFARRTLTPAEAAVLTYASTRPH